MKYSVTDYIKRVQTTLIDYQSTFSAFHSKTQVKSITFTTKLSIFLLKKVSH